MCIAEVFDVLSSSTKRQIKTTKLFRIDGPALGYELGIFPIGILIITC